ncbi:MAG: zinc ribbon domain-containing protein [Casimicrobiaceae bacterium]|nr:zinc ribbon domain-containing protein [Casimicrobiaceae bacterium]
MPPATATHGPSTAPERQARSKFSCVACGGEAVWNAAKQKLLCAFCGTEAALPLHGEAPAGLQTSDIVEQDLAAALRKLQGEHRGWARQARMIQCQHCRAISVLAAEKQGELCEFCGAAALLDYEGDDAVIRPQAVLPAQLSEARAREIIRAWFGKLWWAPQALKKQALTDTARGVYLPYWTFDALVEARWRAEAGYRETTMESVWENGQLKTRPEQRIRWQPASGQVRHFFDDTLVCASKGVHAALLRAIEPFPTTERGAGALKPYDPAYVAGWTVERYQIDLIQAAKLARERMLEATRELCARQVPGDLYRNLEVEADFSRQSFKHILAPVWLLSYLYRGRAYQAVVNAVTGKIAGEYPKSALKITLAALSALGLVLLLLVMQGR